MDLDAKDEKKVRTSLSATRESSVLYRSGIVSNQNYC